MEPLTHQTDYPEDQNMFSLQGRVTGTPYWEPEDDEWRVELEAHTNRTKKPQRFYMSYVSSEDAPPKVHPGEEILVFGWLQALTSPVVCLNATEFYPVTYNDRG